MRRWLSPGTGHLRSESLIRPAKHQLQKFWLAGSGRSSPIRPIESTIRHDQFLSYGRPPMPLVRKAMMGEASGLL
jgi:hypothetical protein